MARLEHEIALRLVREYAHGLVHCTANLPSSPGPKAVLEALMRGGADAACELMGRQATYELLQPILDGIIGDVADAAIAKAQAERKATP